MKTGSALSTFAAELPTLPSQAFSSGRHQLPSIMARTPIERAVSKWSAVIIPLIMIGAAVYGTWCLVVKVAVEYLLNPPKSYRDDFNIYPRRGAGIAVLVLYFIFLFLMSVTYLRTVQVIWMDPGYIPLGRSLEKNAMPGPEFTTKDAFVCDSNGKPRFCDHCNAYKPDRTHHCSEVGRCVKRMDHFCPWAGGIISENNMKFFLQFLVYGFFYNLFLVITLGILMQERKQKTGHYETTWIVAIALASMFGLFSLGMSFSSLYATSQNVTTIENLNKGNAVYSFAVCIGAGPQLPQDPAETKPVHVRNFMILQTDAGDNPWDLGVVRNLKSVLGDRYLDWMLPIKYSPCTKHDRTDGHFEFGPVLQKLKQRAGILPEDSKRSPHRRRRSSHKSHRSHRSSHRSHRSQERTTQPSNRAKKPIEEIDDQSPHTPAPE